MLRQIERVAGSIVGMLVFLIGIATNVTPEEAGENLSRWPLLGLLVPFMEAISTLSPPSAMGGWALAAVGLLIILLANLPPRLYSHVFRRARYMVTAGIPAAAQPQGVLPRPAAPQPPTPSRLPEWVSHDNVLWCEGQNAFGDLHAYGPFCPQDRTRLRYRGVQMRMRVRGNAVVPITVTGRAVNDLIVGERTGVLTCATCKTDWVFPETKSISEARDEALTLIEQRLRQHS